MSPRVLVLGIGNPDRGDDGVGPAVVAALAGRLPPGVGAATARGDLLSLIDTWAGLDALIAVDAAAPMGAPGRLHRVEAGKDPLPPAPATSSHALGLAEALALGRTLGSVPGTVVVLAIEGASFDVGAPMGEVVAAAVPLAARRVLAEATRLAGAMPADA